MHISVDNKSFTIRYNESKARDVIAHILVQYEGYTFEAQYKLFLTISEIGLSKSEFGILCKSIRKDLAVKFVENNALMEYHVDHVMPREHVRIINKLIEESAWYKDQWDKEIRKENPDMKKISSLSRLMHNTMRLLAEFNLGTNIILFIQKKIEMLETNSRSLNIKDLNDLNKYDDVSNNIDNKLNDSSTVSTTPKIGETSEDESGSSNARTIPQVKRNESSTVQGSVHESTEEGSGGTQTKASERTRGAVF